MVSALTGINEILCLGDKWHNDTIHTLFQGVNKKSARNKQVIAALELAFPDNTEDKRFSKRWTPITKTNAKKLNAILKAKTDETFEKRITKYIKHLAYGTHYGMLFNKKEINAFLVILEKDHPASRK